MADVFEIAIEKQQAGRLREAEALYRQVLAQQPDHAGANNLLGVTLFMLGRGSEGFPYVSRSIELLCDHPRFLSNYAAVARSLGKLEEAKSALERANQISPDDPLPLNNLGNVLNDMEDYEVALHAFRRALEIDPQHPHTHFSIFRLLCEIGDYDSAIREFRSALEANANPAAHSDYLLYLHYPWGTSGEFIAEAHREFDQLYAKPLLRQPPEFHNDRTPKRKLRIGYVSPDFRRHPVMSLLEPLLANHNHSRFVVHCYSNAAPDETQTRLRGYADYWIDARGLSDEALYKRIINDKIDILIELAGHTVHNRLLVFARRAAPVQVSCIGYPDTTGLSAMDYRLTDWARDPSIKSDHFYSEKSIRLPDSAWCYQPIPNSPEVKRNRLLNKSFITFGSMNNYRKYTPEMAVIWFKILEAVPNSKLMLALGSDNRPSHFGRKHTLQLFQKHGIGEERLILQNRSSIPDYLNRLNEIDIALDPFPYHGGITTLDNLWMGTPVIVLEGKTYVSRVGVSILNFAGLKELIASSPEQYIELAVALANDRHRLTQYHATLRDRLATSPLMNAKSYTRDVEKAYAELWVRYCASAFHVT